MRSLLGGGDYTRGLGLSTGGGGETVLKHQYSKLQRVSNHGSENLTTRSNKYTVIYR